MRGPQRLTGSSLLAAALLALMTVLAAGPGALVARASGPATVRNQAGRLSTVALSDLGHKTTSISSFVSDGDSFSRQVFWTSGRGAFDAKKAKLASGDLNGDGFPDVLVLYDLGKGRCALYAFLSTGTAFVRSTAWRGRLAWAGARLAVGDASGDGLDDAFVLAVKTAKKSRAVLFTSARTDAANAVSSRVKLTPSELSGLPAPVARVQGAAGDVNADGRAELVCLTGSGAASRLDVLAASGAGWKRAVFWSGSLPAARLACGDADTDGRADAVLLTQAGKGRLGLEVLRSSGTAFEPRESWWRGSAPAALSKVRFALGDVSGDGRADALLLSGSGASSTLAVAVSVPGAFSAPEAWARSAAAAASQLACAPSAPIVLAPQTSVLDDATLVGLSSISPDDAIYHFSTLTPQLGGLRVGDVIAAGPCALASEGILRRITGIEGGGLTLVTEQASLDEVFQSAAIGVHAEVSPDDLLAPTSSVPGVSLVRREARGGPKITIRLDDVKIDSLELDGEVSIEQDWDFACEVGWQQADWHSLPVPTLKRLSFIQTTTQTNDLHITAPVFRAGFQEEAVLSWPMATFVVPVAGVPVTITPTLEVRIGVDGSVDVGVTTGVTETNVLRLGATYENGAFSPVMSFDPSATYEAPTVQVKAGVEAYAKANLVLAIYGAAGPYAGAKAYARLDADPDATPWWTIRYGVDAGVGFEVKLFSHLLADFSLSKKLYEKELAHAGGEASSGTIAFVRDGDIWTMKPDGSGQTNVTNTPGVEEWNPHWSPDGAAIVYLSGAGTAIGYGVQWETTALTVMVRRLSAAAPVQLPGQTQQNSRCATPSWLSSGTVLFAGSPPPDESSPFGDWSPWTSALYTWDVASGLVTRLSPAGAVEPYSSPGGQLAFTSFSPPVGPDAYGNFEMPENLELLDLGSGSRSVLGSGTAPSEITGRNFAFPAISPDGRYVAYGRLYGGGPSCGIVSTRGEAVWQGGECWGTFAWTPDSSRLLWWKLSPGQSSLEAYSISNDAIDDIVTAPFEGFDSGLCVSPDGQSLLLLGANGIWRCTIDGRNVTQLTSDGSDADWGP